MKSMDLSKGVLLGGRAPSEVRASWGRSLHAGRRVCSRQQDEVTVRLCVQV